jgi:hypothetical protein
MTQLEDKLRMAFEAKAADVPSELPPLYLQPVRRPGSVARGGGSRAWPGARRRWLAPLAAAAAVLAVVAAALAAAGALPGAVAPAVPIQTSVPPYYVALINDGLPSPLILGKAVATVRSTATGAVLARIVPPWPYVSFDAVSGAADDRTFVLSARGSSSPAAAAAPERFYLLHINPSASSAAGRVQLTALPLSDIPAGSQVTTMALSPDGTSLAAILDQGLAAPAQLSIYNLVTGTTKVWIRKVCGACGQTTITGAFPFLGPPVAVFMSWTADGKSLAFIPNVYGPQLRLLDLGAPGNDVQPASKPFAIHGVPVLEWQDAYMTPDAKTVFITYQEGKGQTNWTGLLRFSARNGTLTVINKVTQTFEGRPTGGGSDLILWSNYNGSQIIVTGAKQGPVFTSKRFPSFAGPDLTAGIYRGEHYTPIPWPADVTDAAW